jgi:hypothetical protein
MGSHMIDPKAIPVRVIIGSMLKALGQRTVEACVVFREGTHAAVMSNREGADAMARAVFAIQDGALEKAAVALHASRLEPPKGEASGGEPPEQTALCNLVACAGHELEAGGPVTWENLPEPLKEAHRLVAKAVVATAVAHKNAREERVIKPV